MRDDVLVNELAPTVSQLLERHLATAREWFPHELVPWSRARDFEPDWEWSPADSTVPEGVRSALLVNLLTEDNLPYYFATIDRVFGGDTAWGAWARRWTAEEMRHAMVIRDYLTVTRLVDPVALERARMTQVSGGIVPEPDDVADAIVYVALQELATRIAHRNTGKLLDSAGYEVMARVAADENLHHLFYRDVVSEALAVAPSRMMGAIARQVRAFRMPGTGIPEFDKHAAMIAQTGIYDFSVHHDAILVPVVLKHWRVDEVEGLDADGEKAREAAVRAVKRVGVAARRVEARRAEREGTLARAN